MGTCGQPGYVFRDFGLKQGIEFIIFCLNQGLDLSIFEGCLFLDDKQQNFYKRLLINIRVKCLKQGIKKSKFCQGIGKSAIFVLNRVRVRGTAPHLPTQGYIEYLLRDVARLLMRCP